MFLRRFTIAVLASAVLLTAPGAAPAQQVIEPLQMEPRERGLARYEARRGDTLASIARRAGVSLSTLIRINPHLDPDFLRPGDMVLLPGQPLTDRPEPGGRSVYTVRAGDTLSSIARRYDVPVQVIISLNPGLDPRFLRAGDRIRVPAQTVPDRPVEVLDISPARGTLDTVVQINASGFEPRARLRLLAGPGPYNLEPLEQVRADRRGRVFIEAELPGWARPGQNVYFALEARNGRARAVSRPFRVEARQERPQRFSMIGTITNRGTECPLMRGDDGRSYSLLGDLDGFGPGDRVRIEGRRVEMSYCMQGVTIDVRRIEEAD